MPECHDTLDLYQEFLRRAPYLILIIYYLLTFTMPFVCIELEARIASSFLHLSVVRIRSIATITVIQV